MMLPFPTDVEEVIIDQLRNSRRALLKGSLVCKRWQPRCYYHIFRIVHIHTERQLELLNATISLNKKLGEMAKVMILTPGPGANRSSSSRSVELIDLAFVVILPRLPSLSCVKVLAPDGAYMERQTPMRIQKPVMACLRSYARIEELHLRSMSFSGPTHFVTVLASIRSLRTLHCCSVLVHEPNATRGWQLEGFTLPLSSLYVQGINKWLVKALLSLSRSTLEMLSLHITDQAQYDTSPRLSDMRRLRSLMVVVNAVQWDLELRAQAVEGVRNLVTTIPRGNLVYLGITFSGYRLPARVYRPEEVSGRLKVLEQELLMDHFHSLRSVSFTLPGRRSNTTNHWTEAFKEGCSQLEQRGILSLTDPRDQSIYDEDHNTWYTGYVDLIAFSPDSRWIAGLCQVTRTLLLWDIRARTMVCKWRSEGSSYKHLNLAFSPNSRLLALSDPYNIALFKIPSGSHRRDFRLYSNNDSVRQMIMDRPIYSSSRLGSPFSLTWAPDGSKIISGSPSGIIHLIDPKSYHHTILAGHSTDVSSILFSPDGRVMVSGGRDSFCLVWEMDQLDAGVYASKLAPPREQQAVLGPFYKPVMFSPTHGSRFLTKCGYIAVAIWDTSGDYQAVFRTNYRAEILWTAFSPYGELVAVASQDSDTDIVVHIFDSYSGSSLRSIHASVLTGNKGHLGEEDLFWFWSSGFHVVYIDTYNKLRIWDARTGDYVGGDTEYLIYDPIFPALSPDSSVLATATRKGLRVRFLNDCT